MNETIRRPADQRERGERDDGRRTYVAPRIVRRGTLPETTLVSGNQCVFDPPLPDGSCP